MRSSPIAALLLVSLAPGQTAVAEHPLLAAHCGKCHGGKKPKGDFDLRLLGSGPTADNAQRWLNSLDYLKAAEMPPARRSKMTVDERRQLIEFLEHHVRHHDEERRASKRPRPRRLNNRELRNSVADALLIGDVGTNQPMANLLGDTLHDGFDTNAAALGLSEFHLEQYITAFRKIVDATILTGPRPTSRRYEVSSDQLRVTHNARQRRQERVNRTPTSIDLLDLRLRAYFANFETVPTTGRYRIKIRATGMDRGVYDAAATGIHAGDPIRLRVHLGDRTRDFELPDEEIATLELDPWLAAGSKIRLSYPTDGLRLRGNGNFKFQYAIAHDHIKQHDPELYARVVAAIKPRRPGRPVRGPRHWSHWTEHWRGPRPRLFSAEVEGPLYDTWPPKRQVALIGTDPTAAEADEILRPIAARAWRRQVRAGELEPIVRLVQSSAETLGDVGALKEGIVAILASPAFLLLDAEPTDAATRFATKLSYFLRSTIPDQRLRAMAHDGELRTFEAVRAEVQRQFDRSEAGAFLRAFPHAWLQLDRINFMTPDPDRFRLYDRKRLSEDMVAEVLRFFRHAIDENRPVPELLTADYSFVNADLAMVYGIDGVPPDSRLRKHAFADGRRGGLLGMGAFLTLTADSLGTSPIHRAVYVMENFLGIHIPSPPPDVEITEPDVRQAKTIKDILAAHKADPSCASCHLRIDPFGYAFENFNPIGAWRERYTAHIPPPPSRAKQRQIGAQDRQRAAQGLPPLPKPWRAEPIAIDASAVFSSGAEYTDIVAFREHLRSDANRDRFVRCFIEKLLTYANGREPDDYTAIEAILARSAQHGYRIVDTIAAVIDSPLFREP